MRINGIRRASVVAGVALVSALAFGSVAQASTAEAAPAASASDQQAQQAGLVKARGQVEKIGTKVVNGKEVIVFELGAGDIEWIAGDRTSVIKDGEPASPADIEKGDEVTATGHVRHAGHGMIADALRVVVHS